MALTFGRGKPKQNLMVCHYFICIIVLLHNLFEYKAKYTSHDIIYIKHRKWIIKLK